MFRIKDTKSAELVANASITDSLIEATLPQSLHNLGRIDYEQLLIRLVRYSITLKVNLS